MPYQPQQSAGSLTCFDSHLVPLFKFNTFWVLKKQKNKQKQTKTKNKTWCLVSAPTWSVFVQHFFWLADQTLVLGSIITSSVLCVICTCSFVHHYIKTDHGESCCNVMAWCLEMRKHQPPLVLKCHWERVYTLGSDCRWAGLSGLMSAKCSQIQLSNRSQFWTFRSGVDAWWREEVCCCFGEFNDRKDICS